jgi:hypothetical protein
MDGQDKTVGQIGDVTVSVDPNDGLIAVGQDGDWIVFSTTDAIRLSVLLDEAVGLVHGGVKLEKDMA